MSVGCCGPFVPVGCKAIVLSLGRVLISASGGSAKFTLFGSDKQHVDKHCTEVCCRGGVLWSTSNYSATITGIAVTPMYSRVSGEKKDHIFALSTFLIDEHCLRQTLRNCC